MSFSGEVDDARAERRDAQASARSDQDERSRLRSAARIKFEQELNELWDEVEQYWEAHAKRMDSGLVDYVRTGTWAGKSGNLVPKPFPELLTFDVARSLSDWREGNPVRTKRVPGLALLASIAFCAPGDVRELTGALSDQALALSLAGKRDEAEELLKAANRVTWFRLPESDARNDLENDGEPRYGLVFVGPAKKPSWMLRCGASGGIEVMRSDGGEWLHESALRQLVVEAVAKLDY